MKKEDRDFFQDYMPENICFGCGVHNDDGLHVKSYWEGDESVCHWQSEAKYQGWPKLLNGGVMATLVDCHCICTAVAHAYRLENRTLDTAPEYRYATGTLNIKYLLPTPNDHMVEIRARISEVKNKKMVLNCDIYSQGKKTAEAEVIAIRVYDSSQNEESPFKA